MPGEPHKRQSRNSCGDERRERLAQELRANLFKRKALARARRSQGGVPGQSAAELPEDDSSEK